MGRPIEIGSMGDLGSGQMKRVTAGGRELLLARAGDNYYCAENRCPHFGGRLSDGVLDGTIVTCPLHGSKFDLKDGHVVQWTNWKGFRLSLGRIFRSPRPVTVLSVKTQNGKLTVEL